MKRVLVITFSTILLAVNCFSAEEETNLPLKFAVPENLVQNPGFEEEAEGLPAFWKWGISKEARATCEIDNKIFHSGRRAVKLTSASDYAPHVYGGLQQDISVEPNTKYVLSLYAKAEKQERAWFGGDPKWATRKGLPAGSFDWTKFELEFATKDETVWPLRINVDAITEGLWIDNMRLVKMGQDNAVDISSSTRPFTTSPFDASVLKINRNELTRDEDLQVELRVASTKDLGEIEIEFSILDREGKRYAEFPKEKIEIKKGESIVGLKFSTKNISEGVYGLGATMSGKKKEQKEASFTLYSTEEMRDRLLEQVQRLIEITTSSNSSVSELEAKGIDCSYQKIALTVAQNFLKYAGQDARTKEKKRAQDAIQEIGLMLEETKQDLEKILKGKYKPPDVPRYVTGPIKIDGPSFVAGTKTMSGAEEIRPVFFTGYGHFGQVRSDIEKFPAYGINIIQIEFGPNRVLLEEGKVSNSPVEEFLKVADRAAANNVTINLLLSPHYFPEWVKNKYPHLKNCSGGFIKYCIDAPESKKVLEDFLRYVIPQIKDHPALHSICLSNEPVYIESRNCEFTKNMWKEWLQKKHKDIQALNKNYNAGYNSFEEVPIPEPKVNSEPAFYDWTIFNAERFAGWHKWMADIVHEIAPNLPVHAKIMMWCAFDRATVGWGVDPELFGELSQINGNDCGKYYEEYKDSWLIENMAYDLQASTANKPVFNSENHLIKDRDFSYIPPVHIRNVLWQGAIHGQSATTIWVWERTLDKKSDFAGSIMHRPACSQMAGITNLDLLRFSKEVSAIQKLKPQILLLYSISSIVYSNQYLTFLRRAYEVLNFYGVKLGFVTERQLAGGKLPDAKVIIIPGATHTTDTAYTGLKNFIERGGKVVFVGEGLLSYNEYNKPRREEIKPFIKTDITSDKEKSFEQVYKIISGLGLERPVELVESSSGKPLFGVEYLAVKDGNRLIVNLVNYTQDIKSVKILSGGKPVSTKNLFDGKQTETLSLVPLEPMLVEIK